MWLLQSCSSVGSYYALLPEKEYVVGRKDCEIIFEDDRSVSRRHAVLKVIKPKNAENLVPFQLKIADCSKFGTSVNDVKLTSEYTLNDGDEIMFGILGNRWRVKFNQVIVTTSCLKNSSEKKAIQKAVDMMGGRCVSEWNEHCTHLIMENLIMTIKAVCALVSAKPIVTPSYLQSWLKSINERKQFPDIMRYIPPLKEDSLQKEDIKLHPCVERKTLFKGKIFYFLSSKQLVKLKMAVELGSGQVTLLTTQPKDSLILSADSIVVSYPSSEPSQSKESLLAQLIVQVLKSNSKRAIHESEIGLAVAFNSVTKYCNPDFIVVSSLLKPFEMASQIATQSNTQILVPDTQTFTSQTNYTEDRTQQCSVDDDIKLFDSKNFQSCQTLNGIFKIETVDQSQFPSRDEKKRLRNENLEDSVQSVKKIKTERNDENFIELKENPTLCQKDNVNESDSNIQNDQCDMSTDMSQVNKPSGKIHVSLISKGFDGDDEENVSQGTKHEVVIEVKSLIKRFPANLQIIEPTNDVPNFKKFKKVFNYSYNRTPVIRKTSLIEYEEAAENVQFWIPKSLQVNDQQQESQENPFA